MSSTTDSPTCPTCESPEKRWHPATQHDGEVIALCRDPWHKPTAEEIEAKERARKRFRPDPRAGAATAAVADARGHGGPHRIPILQRLRWAR